MNQNEQDCDYQLLKNHHKNLAMQKLSTTQPFEVGCMDKVRFVVLYGGEWIKSANRNESSIKMKFIFNSPEVLAPFEVVVARWHETLVI
ncbi:hypothetical protein Q3G72_015748 [Acer saccharum]|nr:hypothetical protein Q3G72_015748 [Acer saccharum]